MEDDGLEHELHGGFETMDVEHARQAHTIRVIENAVRRGGDRAAIQGLLLGLIEDTRAHFESEQALMRHWRYPGYDAHTTEHRRLLEELISIKSGQVSGGLDITEGLLASLRKWLTETHPRHGPRTGALPSRARLGGRRNIGAGNAMVLTFTVPPECCAPADSNGRRKDA